MVGGTRIRKQTYHSSIEGWFGSRPWQASDGRGWCWPVSLLRTPMGQQIRGSVERKRVPMAQCPGPGVRDAKGYCMFTHVSRGPDGCDLLSFVMVCYGFLQGRVFARHTGLL